MSQAYHSVYAINRLQLQVRLGCEAEERKYPQRVEVDIRFYHPSVPPESLEDNRQGFICHDKVTAEVVRVATTREFHLVEYLGMELFNAVRAMVRPEVKLWMRTTKKHIMVKAQLEGGAAFTHTDLPEGAWVAPH